MVLPIPGRHAAHSSRAARGAGDDRTWVGAAGRVGDRPIHKPQVGHGSARAGTPVRAANGHGAPRAYAGRVEGRAAPGSPAERVRSASPHINAGTGMAKFRIAFAGFLLTACAVAPAIAAEIRIACYSDGNECEVTQDLAQHFMQANPDV